MICSQKTLDTTPKIVVNACVRWRIVVPIYPLPLGYWWLNWCDGDGDCDVCRNINSYFLVAFVGTVASYIATVVYKLFSILHLY